MKRLCILLLAAALLLGVCGCSLFDSSSYEVTAYSAEAEEESGAEGVGYISDYAALKRAIVWLVSEHEESAELQFQNYDGNISRDLSQACWEVKSSTPVGAFAVDYTSFDLSRIVSFYQADVFITYKRSAEQMDALEQLSGLSAFLHRLDEALAAGETYLVLQMTAASLDAELVENYIRRAYYANALSCPVLPEAQVLLYPESGVERIVEITLDYGTDADTLDGMRRGMEEACAALLAAITQELPQEDAAAASGDMQTMADTLYAAARLLRESCTADVSAGHSAYDALVLKTADSEGIAMAFQALCSSLGQECQVVSGRLDNESHFWNIVTLGGESYHVDLAALEESFLTGDEDMWGRYWWDTDVYPPCAEDYHYFGGTETAASEEQGRMPEGVLVDGQ